MSYCYAQYKQNIGTIIFSCSEDIFSNKVYIQRGENILYL